MNLSGSLAASLQRQLLSDPVGNNIPCSHVWGHVHTPHTRLCPCLSLLFSLVWDEGLSGRYKKIVLHHPVLKCPHNPPQSLHLHTVVPTSQIRLVNGPGLKCMYSPTQNTDSPVSNHQKSWAVYTVTSFPEVLVITALWIWGEKNLKLTSDSTMILTAKIGRLGCFCKPACGFYVVFSGRITLRMCCWALSYQFGQICHGILELWQWLSLWRSWTCPSLQILFVMPSLNGGHNGPATTLCAQS